MGSERQLRSTKRQLKNINYDGEDRISELPDSPLEHILAFLPTKTAVSTSILSKRWSQVWTDVPILHLELLERSLTCGIVRERDFRLEITRIMKLVDRTLYLHKAPKLRKFYLKFESIDPYFDNSGVTEWITNAIRRNVENLILFLDLKKSFRLPCCLFTCESLIKLDITMEDVLDLPNAVSFPKLKVLKLTKIRIKDENLAQLFFSNCPVLEVLNLHCCKFRGMKFLSISTAKLKSLSINDAKGTHVVKIYAPSLSSFTFTESGPMDYVLDSFPTLIHADIYFTCRATSRTMREERGYVAAKLLGKLSNVNSLRINTATFQAMSFAGGFLTNFPTFHNLIHLEVRIDYFELIAAETFLDFLKISPSLESLVFVKCYQSNWCSNRGASWTLNLVPSCFLLNLKSIEFPEFVWSQREVIMVKFFLEHAGVLQRITLIADSCISLKKRDKILKQLMEFPKASTNCVVTLLEHL